MRYKNKLALPLMTMVTTTALLTPPQALAYDYGGSGVSNVYNYQGGSVDVTPIRAKPLNDGSGAVKYTYQISAKPLLSSGHIQSARILHIALPSFAENVEFRQKHAITLQGMRERMRPFQLDEGVHNYLYEKDVDHKIDVITPESPDDPYKARRAV